MLTIATNQLKNEHTQLSNPMMASDGKIAKPS